MVDQKCFLVKLEIYWQTFNETASCHRFVQQAEFYQCPCIPRLNIFFFCRFQNLNKNTSFQKHFSSNHIPPLPFHCGFLIMLWSIGNDILYVFDVDLELVYKTSHTSYHMTDLLHCILVFLVDCETHGCFMK